MKRYQTILFSLLVFSNVHAATSQSLPVFDPSLLPIEKGASDTTIRSFVTLEEDEDTRSSTPTTAKTNFKCNLFENTGSQEILSAINSLNQAVNAPKCSQGKIDVKTIVDSNKKIQEAVEGLQAYLNNPETVNPEQIPNIVNTVDQAIRAANGLANTFAQSGVLNSDCRDAMSGGQVALAINDILNGLTPYALMASSLTGGTAAIPYIVGGTVITGAISSMSKIISENSIKVEDAQVRRAIVENTCQYIRLDQKYKFLIKNREEQVVRITTDVNSSRRLFTNNLALLSTETANLVNRSTVLASTSAEVNSNLADAKSQLNLDKQFLKSTSDDIKICQLGIQLALFRDHSDSYVSKIMNSLDQSLIAYGTSQSAQAQALKMSANIAVQNLTKASETQFNIDSDFKNCARNATSLVDTLDQTMVLSKELLKLAQTDLDKELGRSKEYGQIKSGMDVLNQKQLQATRVTNSLDNLKKYATSIAQSEIDSEMDRLRKGIFGSNSPALKWLQYVQNLHRADVSKFKDGLNSLRRRAYALTASGKATKANPLGIQLKPEQVAADNKAAQNLQVFNLNSIQINSTEYMDSCRELSDVWSRWVTAVDHLAAMDSFCSMISPYIYDSRSEDRNLIVMCRGLHVSSMIAGQKNSASTLSTLKDQLVREYTKDWALVVQSRMTTMNCPTPTMD